MKNRYFLNNLATIKFRDFLPGRMVIFFSIAILLSSSNLLAQNNTAQNNTAHETENRLKKAAARYFEEGDFMEAYPLYSQLLSLYPRDPNYNYRFGACMLFTKADKNKAADYLAFSVKQPNVDDLAYYYLGRALHLNYKFNEAIRSYKKFEQIASPSELKKYPVKHFIEMCTSGKALLSAVQGLDVLRKKELNLTDYFEAYDMHTNGGKLLSEPDGFKTKIDKEKDLNNIIYLTPNKKQAYFSSYGNSEKNGKDIFVVKRMPDGSWGTPENLGEIINTPFDEDYPVYDVPRHTLYFCSKGHSSMGGYDIFMSVYNVRSNTWGEPVNLDFPINSPDDDILFVPDTAGQTAFFSSTRSSPQGTIDVYKIAMHLHPPPSTIISGIAYLDNGKTPSLCKITVTDNRKDSVIGVYSSSSEDGKYSFNLPNGGSYTFKVEADNHKTQSQSVVLPVSETVSAVKEDIEFDPSGYLQINNSPADIPKDSDSQLAFNYIKEEAQMNVNVDTNTIQTSLVQNTPSNSLTPNSSPPNSQVAAVTTSGNTQQNVDNSTPKNHNQVNTGTTYLYNQELKKEVEQLNEKAEKAIEYASDKLEDAVQMKESAENILNNQEGNNSSGSNADSIAKAKNMIRLSKVSEQKGIAAYGLAAEYKNEAAEKQLKIDNSKNANSIADYRNHGHTQNSDHSSNEVSPGGTSPGDLIMMQVEQVKEDSFQVAKANDDLSQGIKDSQLKSQDYVSQASQATDPQQKVTLLQHADDLSKDKQEKEKIVKENNTELKQLHYEFNWLYKQAIIADSISISSTNSGKNTSHINPATEKDLQQEIDDYTSVTNSAAVQEPNDNAGSRSNSKSRHGIHNRIYSQPGNNAALSNGNNTSAQSNLQNSNNAGENSNSQIANSSNSYNPPNNGNNSNSTDGTNVINTNQNGQTPSVDNNNQGINNTIVTTDSATKYHENHPSDNNSVTYTNEAGSVSSAKGLTENTPGNPPSNNSPSNPINADGRTLNSVNTSNVDGNDNSVNRGRNPEANILAAKNNLNNNSTLENTSDSTNAYSDTLIKRKQVHSLPTLFGYHKITTPKDTFLDSLANSVSISKSSDNNSPKHFKNQELSDVSSIQYTDSLAVVFNQKSEKYFTAASSLVENAEKTRSKAQSENDKNKLEELYHRADSLDDLIFQLNLKGDETLAEANYRQYSTNLYQIASISVTPNKKLAYKVTAARRLIHDADNSYRRSVSEKDRANSSHTLRMKYTYIKSARQDLATAILRQQSAVYMCFQVDSAQTENTIGKSSSDGSERFTFSGFMKNKVKAKQSMNLQASQNISAGNSANNNANQNTNPDVVATNISPQNQSISPPKKEYLTPPDQNVTNKNTDNQTAINEKNTPTEAYSQPNENISTNNTAAPELPHPILSERTDIFTLFKRSPYSISNPIPIDPPLPMGLIFEIQVGAFKNPIKQNLFKGFEPIIGLTAPQGFIRYSAGLFRNIEPARDALGKIKSLGFPDAFIIAFYNGKRITIQEALAKLGITTPQIANSGNMESAKDSTLTKIRPQTTNDNTQPEFTKKGKRKHSKQNGNSTNSEINENVQPRNNVASSGDNKMVVIGRNTLNPSQKAIIDEHKKSLKDTVPPKAKPMKYVAGLVYTVQVGSFPQHKDFVRLSKLKKLYSSIDENGTTRYNCGTYKSMGDAKAAKDIILANTTVTDAFVSAYYNGMRISLEKAADLLKNGVEPTTSTEQKSTSGRNANESSISNNPGSSSAGTETNTQPTPAINSSLSNKISSEDLVNGSFEEASKNKVIYTVQIGSYSGELPVDVANKILTHAKEGIEPYSEKHGVFTYFAGKFTNIDAANTLQQRLYNEGFRQAFIAAFFNGKKISLEEAQSINSR